MCYNHSMMIARHLDLPRLLAVKSSFLFGARLTGKSTLIKQQLRGRAEIVDLLDAQTFLQASTDPLWLEGVVKNSKHKLIVIDEVQRLPALLNTVQQLMGSERVCFLLTGSSVRKLRRGGANFLGGRASMAHLFPLTWKELPDFDLQRYLHCGGLPSVYLSEQPQVELSDYVLSYMREEVLAEGFIRDLPPFSRFLQTMAHANGELLNFTKLASDCHVPVRDIKTYVQILEDTLLGALLQPWHMVGKRKAVMTAKFYFFDTGVARVLAGVKNIERHSNLYGRSFEHFIWMELRAYLAYRRLSLTELSFWRTKHGQEVDFLVGQELAIEVKAATRVSTRDLKGLRALAEEGVFKKFYLVSQDRNARTYETFHLMHWETFLTALWNDELLDDLPLKS